MHSGFGQARLVHARVTRASLLLLTVATLFLVASLPRATAASTIADKRAEARSVENQIMNQQAALEKQIEKYNAVHQHYVDTRRKLANNKIVLAVARKNLQRSQVALGKSLTSSYKSTGEDVVSYLLASHSFSDLIDHVQTLQRANDANTQLIRQITQTKKLIADRTHQLSVETSQLARDQRDQLAAKQHVEAGLRSLQARKSQISSDIQHLIDEQQRRQQAAAEAAAAAAAGGGGGGGSVNTSTGNIPAPPTSTLGGQAVAIAEQYLGVPYVWGGASPSGFDCSGLVMYVYSRLGVSLPHNAAAQYGMGAPVPRDALEPGDLVFFDGLGHVGIYVGGGSFIHAPHTGTVVQISSLSGWYSSEYVGARRIG
jgi:peptidoglycan DL-endopeptidase CwlO